MSSHGAASATASPTVRPSPTGSWRSERVGSLSRRCFSLERLVTRRLLCADAEAIEEDAAWEFYGRQTSAKAREHETGAVMALG